MDKCQFLLCFFVGCYSLVFPQTNEIDVYLIGGQSNATGQGYMVNIPSDFSVNSEVLLFHSHLMKGEMPYVWRPLHQASESTDRFGVELSLGTKLKEFFPDKKMALIKHAYSGSNLFEDWNPGENIKDTIAYGIQFKHFVKTVNKGLDDLRSQGFVPKIKGMVWQQGEGDAREDSGIENSKNYGKNLRHFIKRVRKQFGAKAMLFIYGYVIPVPQKVYAGREEVRSGQRYVDQDSGRPLALKNAFVVSTDDLPIRADEPHSPYPNDKIHFNTYGILELGNRFAEKIKEHQ
ncbi:sialate O-acetylesterase [uncultured Kriegella sp.]|uniref:sialate O-acetylesterase n=1 Tax=uncultured Kriegella sp. TaxID=1798910 RepID=UPI0030DDAE1E|tara:strand:+ start:59202 stop:60071 length:870 start_codon:yes stop_codon:yes gene_type:complete